jgi:hypothetical protein
MGKCLGMDFLIGEWIVCRGNLLVYAYSFRVTSLKRNFLRKDRYSHVLKLGKYETVLIPEDTFIKLGQINRSVYSYGIDLYDRSKPFIESMIQLWKPFVERSDVHFDWHTSAMCNYFIFSYIIIKTFCQRNLIRICELNNQGFHS